MGNRWISDFVGTFKTAIRIGRAVIDTSATSSGTPTVLATSNTGIRIPDTDGLAWIGQIGLLVSRTATDTIKIVGTSNGFQLKVGNQPDNHFSSLVDTVAGFRITGGTGTNTAPTYTFNGNNTGTGIFLKVKLDDGATKLGITTQPTSTSTGRCVADFSLGVQDLLHGSADTVPPFFYFNKSRGTSNSPSALTSGDLLGHLGAKGYVGSTGGYVESAAIEFVSTGTIADSASGVGGEIALFTRTVGGSLTERARMAHTGIMTFAKAIKTLVIQPTPQTVSFSATPSIDVSLGDPVDMTLTGNVTAATLTGGVDGQKITLRIKQDGTGGRTWAFDSTARFGTDITSITLSTAASKLDYIGLVYNSAATKYDVVAFTKGF